MTTWLFDVNFLIARLWKTHDFHGAARAWTAAHENEDWATCPITQAGFARTISNPGFSLEAPSPSEAIHWLGKTLAHHPTHQFWADDVSLSSLSAQIRRRLQGPKQITDAYLLTLAVHHNGKLVTFDKGIRELCPAGSRELESLLILRP